LHGGGELAQEVISHPLATTVSSAQMADLGNVMEVLLEILY